MSTFLADSFKSQWPTIASILGESGLRRGVKHALTLSCLISNSLSEIGETVGPITCWMLAQIHPEQVITDGSAQLMSVELDLQRYRIGQPVLVNAYRRQLLNDSQWPQIIAEIRFGRMLTELGAQVVPHVPLSNSPRNFDLGTSLQGETVNFEVKWVFDNLLRYPARPFEAALRSALSIPCGATVVLRGQAPTVQGESTGRLINVLYERFEGSAEECIIGESTYRKVAGAISYPADSFVRHVQFHTDWPPGEVVLLAGAERTTSTIESPTQPYVQRSFAIRLREVALDALNQLPEGGCNVVVLSGRGSKFGDYVTDAAIGYTVNDGQSTSGLDGLEFSSNYLTYQAKVVATVGMSFLNWSDEVMIGIYPSRSRELPVILESLASTRGAIHRG